ncbi:MAG: AN1-type zinc finger domain-containing protein [Promethearchaeota archaeon]
MTNCYFCDKRITTIPYRCKSCGMIFCSKHRIPENHECPFDLRRTSEFEDSFRRLSLLYQDALDFINKDLTVAKVYEYFTTKQMDDLEATELLIHFIENSEDPDIRSISIQAFKVLKLKNNNVFQALENCILSDDDPIIRKTAIEIIREMFPKKSQNILNWIQKSNNNS